MANIDIFNPVLVNLTIQEPTGTPMAVNNTALMTTNITALPLVDLVKRYSDADSVSTDFGAGSAEHLFATQYFNLNQGLSYLIVVSFDASTPTAGYLAAAVEAGYNKTVTNGWGGFSWLGWATISYLSDDTTTITELNAIQAFAIDNKISIVTIATVNDADIYNQTTGNMLELIQQQDYSGSLIVSVHGAPAFASDPAGSNKRTDASCFGMLSSASEQTLSQMAFFGQVFEGVEPIPVGEPDSSFTITFTKSLINTLVNNQLNLYSQYADRDIFALGVAANQNKFLEYRVIASKLFIQQLLTRELMVYFQPATLTYDQKGVAAAYSTLNASLKQLSANNVIEPTFTITQPNLDPEAIAPRVLGPWDIKMSVGATVFGITVDGVIAA